MRVYPMDDLLFSPLPCTKTQRWVGVNRSPHVCTIALQDHQWGGQITAKAIPIRILFYFCKNSHALLG